MMPTLFESKYNEVAFLPFPCNRYQCSSRSLGTCCGMKHKYVLDKQFY